MILTKSVSIRSNSKTINKYREKGYIVSLNEIFEVSIEDLMKGSNAKILAKCDECGLEVNTTYKLYNRNIKNYNFFTCKKCKHIKAKKTSLEKYGDSTYNNKVLNKKTFLTTLISRYEKIEGFINYDNLKKTLTIKCKKCSNIYTESTHFYFQRKRFNKIICPYCNPRYIYQQSQQDVSNYIKSFYNKTVLSNNRSIIKPQEIDIYIPELKIGFEFNGLYWHSELQKPDNYHQDKIDLAWDKGVRLVHIWEDDWMYKQDIVKSKILEVFNRIKDVYSTEECYVKEVSYDEGYNFLNDNDLRGYIDYDIGIGLYAAEVLLEMLAIDKDSNDYKIVRRCNRINSRVIDGINVIFNYFRDKYKPNMVSAYEDCDWNVDKYSSIWLSLDFKYLGDTDKDIWVLQRGIKESYVNEGIKIYGTVNYKYVYDIK